MKPSNLRLYRTLPRHDPAAPCALTIGNFDGVHLGHQAILEQVRLQADALGLIPTVMTFTPHPRAYFARLRQRPDLVPAQISGLRDKLCLLAHHGIRQVAVQRFNQPLADMRAEDFIRELLVRGLSTRWLLVGEDFRYGHKRSGDLALLRRLGRDCGFQVQTLADIPDAQGQRISSSALRAALAAGDLARGQALLGRRYHMSGHVIHGRKLGRTLGFPTLNLRVTAPCAARTGIYVVRVNGLETDPLPGVASLGVRPTVTRHGALLLETHILDRHVDAYGKLVCVEFLEFLRAEESFPDLMTLTAAIRQDAQRARDYFASHGL